MNRISTNPIIKKTLAILLICLICFSCFLPAPPADAAIVSTVIAVAATVAIGTIFIALGVLPGDDGAGFDDAVSSCVDALIEQGKINATIAMSVIAGVAYIPQTLVSDVKDYLFDSGVVYEEDSGYSASTVFVQGGNFSVPIGTEYVGYMSTSSNQYIPVSLFLDNVAPARVRNDVNLFCTQRNIPIERITFIGSAYAYGSTRTYIIVDSFNVPVFRHPSYSYEWVTAGQNNVIINCVLTSSGGNPSLTTSGDMPLYNVTGGNFSSVIHNYGTISGGGICSDQALELNQNLRDNAGIDEIYPDWAQNEQAYEQENEDVIGVPLSVPETYDEVLGLSQEQAWAGDIAMSLQGVDTNVGTIADSMPGILENTGSIATSVSDVATQVGSLVDFFTGSVAVSSPIEGIAFGDLFEKFPFSLPFELVNALSCWVADPVAPDMIVPLPRFTTASNFEIYEYRVNFADIPNMPLAAAMCRGGWMLLFTIGLYKITSSFIKW